MKSIKTDETLVYYNENAMQYFANTVNANMSEFCDRFASCVKPEGELIDIGAGSGRDVRYFLKLGFRVDALDASEVMCKLASEYTGVNVKCQRIQDWMPIKKYDAVWANASLVHLTKEEIGSFICKLPKVLTEEGVAYISLKGGIDSGWDCLGRYFSSFCKEEVVTICSTVQDLVIEDIWETSDLLEREGIYWINIILKKRRVYKRL